MKKYSEHEERVKRELGRLKEGGFMTAADEAGARAELMLSWEARKAWRRENRKLSDIYSQKYSDAIVLEGFCLPDGRVAMETLEELMERDQQRDKDGFPKKIRIGRIVRQSGGQVIVVPTTTEEKLIHGQFDPNSDEDESGEGDEGEGEGEGSSTGGSGEGEEGDVIGESPATGDGEGEGEEGEAGEGSGGSHGIEEGAYEAGRMLTDKFELPNLKDKGKKVAVPEYFYDLTDKFKGAGQILDKNATIKEIIKTNNALGNVDPECFDPTQLKVSRSDMIYRILSREKKYLSQAIVFFVRDYSGSMWGKPTEAVVAQHVMLYFWLVFQYEKRLMTRFILHDSEAKEVPSFDVYARSIVAGGTKVASGYRKVNEIVEKENLARNYNIYVFHGTDGDDWDKDGKAPLEEVEKIMQYANRMGVSVARGWSGGRETAVEKYFEESGLLKTQSDLLRLDAFNAEEANDDRLIEGIKKLVS